MGVIDLWMFDGTDTSERGFAGHHPVVDENGMTHEKRRHTEAGGVPDAEVTLEARVERHKRVG